MVEKWGLSFKQRFFSPLVWRKNDGKSKRISAVYCSRAILIQSFPVWVVSLLFTFWKLLHICISPSLLKSKFQKDYWQETRSKHFHIQSASFVYAKANESHPMHGAVIFRMKGKCTLKERALSRLNLKLDPQSSIIETWDLILESFENRVSRLETWVTVNLLLSGTMGAQNVIRMKKLRFSGHQRAKVGSQGPMG